MLVTLQLHLQIFLSALKERQAQEGKDLFPDDFVYSLPTADNYFGIEQLFSTNEAK